MDSKSFATAFYAELDKINNPDPEERNRRGRAALAALFGAPPEVCNALLRGENGA